MLVSSNCEEFGFSAEAEDSSVCCDSSGLFVDGGVNILFGANAWILFASPFTSGALTVNISSEDENSIVLFTAKSEGEEVSSFVSSGLEFL